MKINKNFIIKLIVHIIGSIFIGFGVQSIIYSSLGAAPLDALTAYLAKIHVHLFSGNLQVIVGIYSLTIGTLLTLILFLFRREKKLIFTWLNIALVAGIISLWGILFKNPIESNSITGIQIVFGVVGIISIAFGVSLTITTGLPPGPHEELLNRYDERLNNLFLSKLIIEVTYLIMAVITMIIYVSLTTSITSIRDLDFTQIGYFTIITVIGISGLVFVFNFVIEKIQKYIHQKRKEDEDESKSVYWSY